MLVNSKQILKKAQKGRYAIGQFNTNNLETNSPGLINRLTSFKAVVSG